VMALTLGLVALGGTAASAHNDSCIIAVHVGGIRVHPNCG
jgi:hypothetical protein